MDTLGSCYLPSTVVVVGVLTSIQNIRLFFFKYPPRNSFLYHFIPFFNVIIHQIIIIHVLYMTKCNTYSEFIRYNLGLVVMKSVLRCRVQRRFHPLPLAAPDAVYSLPLIRYIPPSLLLLLLFCTSHS